MVKNQNTPNLYFQADEKRCNDDLGQEGFLGFGFRHPVYLSLFLSLLRSPSVAPVSHTCTRILHIGATDDGDVRYFTCCCVAAAADGRGKSSRFAALSSPSPPPHILGGRRGEGRRRRRRRRRHDSHADRHRRESRAGERITRPGTGSSLTTTTAKIRASPVASLFPLHRWEEEREGGGGCG